MVEVLRRVARNNNTKMKSRPPPMVTVATQTDEYIEKQLLQPAESAIATARLPVSTRVSTLVNTVCLTDTDVTSVHTLH